MDYSLICTHVGLQLKYTFFKNDLWRVSAIFLCGPSSRIIKFFAVEYAIATVKLEILLSSTVRRLSYKDC